MKFDNNLIYLLGLSIFLVFFGGRILGILLKGFWDNFVNRDPKRNQNFDEMVKEQERILRSRMKIGPAAAPQPSPQGKKSKTFSDSEDSYLLAKEKDQKIEGLDKILELFDNARWGQGKIYQEILNKAKLKTNCQFDLLGLSQIVTKFLRENFFLKTKKELAGFNEIEKAILSKLILVNLVKESTQGNGPLLSGLAKKKQLDPKFIIMAIHFEFMKFKGETASVLYERIVKVSADPAYLRKFPDQVVSDLMDKQIPLPDKSGYLGPDYFLKNLFQTASIFENVIPLPPLKNKKDIEGAFKVLGVRENASLDEIKRVYKNLAKSKHPDVLAAKGLPPSLEKTLTNNFSILQQAYEILKDQKK